MVILDPSLEERTVEPSLDKYLNVIRKDGGTVDSVDVWGRRRLAYEIQKNAEGIYAVIQLNAEPATVKEFNRQLGLNESVLRTKVLRPPSEGCGRALSPVGGARKDASRHTSGSNEGDLTWQARPSSPWSATSPTSRR